REQYAEIIGQPGKYITYSFFPERGVRNIQLNVLVDEQGNRHKMNEMVVFRSIPLGWMFGERFKDQTELNAFADTPKNKQLLEELLKTIDTYDTMKPEPGTRKTREKMIEKMLSILERVERTPVYVSHEDGVIDWLPQESTTYLFANPSRGKRIKATVRNNETTAVQQPLPVYPSHEYLSRMHPLAIQNPNGDIVRIRIENSWDLWPGNYWGLNRFRLGKHPNTMKPFEHYNNGAYTIHDDHGVIAQVVFRDLLWSYGEDVVYLYFLDKNGDGKIDREKELIGQVLYRISQDEITDLEPVIGRGMEKKDVTQRYVYTFMAGHDGERRHEEFYLCNAIESFITNELNRGFGQHSVLGYVNNQRSNILFLENRSMANLGRALSPESSLVAKYDIVALLRAAGRTYIERYVQEEGKASAQP
ncbi:hypothetical protein HYS48_04995, partial [Candidatus Woesearchaeota archaeon]|nr:hypothetical protein [Candidatus Woesearchaeota archaeon]